MTRPLIIMLVAAEGSGDSLGAGLARALKARLGERVRFVGIGGPRMAEEGVDSPFDIADLAIVGIVDALRAAGRVRRAVRDAVVLAEEERPDVAVLIDSWGYTIRVAKALRTALPDLPLVKYVGPQVWASRPGRAKTLATSVDHLLALYPFDAPWFEREGLPTTVVGSQALHIDFSKADPVGFRRSIGVEAEDPLLLVLPGSRPSEIARLTPVFEQAVARLKQDRPRLAVAVIAAGTVAADVRGRVAAWPFRAHVVEEGQKRDAMVAADVALACSGTVSTELALAGTPMIIAYRMDGPSFALARRMVTVSWVTLINIAATEMVVPEYLQDDATPEALAGAVGRLLDDPEARRVQAARQTAVLDIMGCGGPDPSNAAAAAILELLKVRRPSPAC